eukprot:4518228-Ditylum_brightwellii.AAC.1
MRRHNTEEEEKENVGDLINKKEEDKLIMVDKGTDAKKVSMKTEGTMMDAVEFADEKVSVVIEVSKVPMQE